MNISILKNSRGKGIILGILIAVMLTGFGIPPAFAVVVGIIFGFVAYVVLSENNREM